ncbi:MAG TPA: hypothetical protein P5136_07245 [Methanofastidiosum sp.]|nr:hypothetical protein [Methanofastidiosum sp.]
MAKEKVKQNEFENQLKYFLATNSNYSPTMIPIPVHLSAFELMVLESFLEFKLEFAQQLDLDAKEVSELEKMKESWTETYISTLGKEKYEELRKINSKLISAAFILDIPTSLLRITDSLETQENKLVELEKYLDKEFDKLSKKASKLISPSNKKNPPKEKLESATKLMERISAVNNKIGSFYREVLFDIYPFLVTLVDPMLASPSVVRETFKDFIQHTDKRLFYFFSLLNNQNNRFVYIRDSHLKPIIENKGEFEEEGTIKNFNKEEFAFVSALVIGGKDLYPKIQKELQENSVAQAKDMQKLAGNIKIIKPKFSKIIKILALYDLMIENLTEEEKMTSLNSLATYNVAPQDILQISIELLFQEMDISDNYDALEYLEGGIEQKNINLISLMLLTDLIRFHYPVASLDSSGYFISKGAFGIKKKYLSKSEIYELIEKYKSNKERYALYTWKKRLDNLTDNDYLDYRFRQLEKEKAQEN